MPKYGEQTAGLVQVVEARSDSSAAVVVYLCGELYAGDSVEPFDPQPLFRRSRRASRSSMSRPISSLARTAQSSRPNAR